MRIVALVFSIVLCLGASPYSKNSEKLFWDEVKDSSDVDMLRLYKTKYPNGVFESIADIKIKRLLRAKNENKQEELEDGGEPFWIKGRLDYKYFGLGRATTHFKGKHYQENLARSRAKRDLQKEYERDNLSNEKIDKYNDLLQTKKYTDERGKIYILLYLDNYDLD